MKTHAAGPKKERWWRAAIGRGIKEGKKVIFIFLRIFTSVISQWSILNLFGPESRACWIQSVPLPTQMELD